MRKSPSKLVILIIIVIVVIIGYFVYNKVMGGASGVFAQVLSINTREYGSGREFKINPHQGECGRGGALQKVTGVKVVYPDHKTTQELAKDVQEEPYSGECTYRYVYYGHGEGYPPQGTYQFILTYKNGDEEEVLTDYKGDIMPQVFNLKAKRVEDDLEVTWQNPEVNLDYHYKVIIFADTGVGREYFEGSDLISQMGEKGDSQAILKKPPFVDNQKYFVHLMLHGDEAFSDNFVELVW